MRMKIKKYVQPLETIIIPFLYNFKIQTSIIQDLLNKVKVL